MYLLIDNYDSFAYNLYQSLIKQGAEVAVYRNDAIGIDQVRKMNPEKIIISPGPKTPRQAGISNELIRTFYKEIPILGICLGFQCIGMTFGGKLQKVRKIVHGKTSVIYHDKSELFKGVLNPLKGGRYHSLMIDCSPLKKEFDFIAFTQDGGRKIVMGLKNTKYPLYGLLFHPESFLTESGDRIIKNFIDLRY